MPRVKYEEDTGVISFIRLSAKKLAVAGTPPGGTVADVRRFVAADGSTARKLVLVARRAIYTREDPVGTTGRVSTQRVAIPILTKDGVASAPATINYNGKTDWLIAGVIAES